MKNSLRKTDTASHFKRIYTLVFTIVFYTMSISLAESVHDLRLLSEKKAIGLYQMMKDVHEIFTLHKLPYWITGGTLLGAVGYGGLIPWDDDLDVCIDIKHKNRLLKIKPELKKLGYRLVPKFFGYHILGASRRQLDVFFMKKAESNYFYANKRARRIWGKLTQMKIHDVYPLKEYLFGDCVVMGPHDPSTFLDFGYRNWRTEALVRNHSTYRRSNKRIYLKKGDRFPALPFGPLKNRVLNSALLSQILTQGSA